MYKVLGFDIGVASIGWAFVEGGELKDCGVRIFTKAENPKNGSSLALPRREARGVRRRLARRKGRLNALKVLICKEFGLNRSDYLANAGELPKAYKIAKCENPKYDKYKKCKDIRKNGNERDRQELTQEIEKIDTNPYKLRTEALERKLSADEFARVILHIAKHRGYGNKHAKKLIDSDDKEGKVVLQAISENKTAMQANNRKTIGEYLYCDILQKRQKIRNTTDNYERCISQDLSKEELKIIFDKQRKMGFEPTLSQKFENEILEITFYQRDLKSFEDKVGYCTFYINEKRAPKDSISAMEFIALTRIINTLTNLYKRCNGLQLLSDNSHKWQEHKEKCREYIKKYREKIWEVIYNKGDINYKTLRNIIDLPKHINFPNDIKLDYTNLKDAENAKFIDFTRYEGKVKIGNRLKKFIDILGDDFKHFVRADLDKIAEIITPIKSKTNLKEALAKVKLQNELNKEQIEKLSNLNFSQYINLSFKALDKILPYMRDGFRYDKAVEMAQQELKNPLPKIEHKNNNKTNKLPALKDYEPNLTNPVVARALAEYRKVLNALLKKYGKVHKIHLEFTRQAGVSSKERGEIIAEQNKRFKANEEARKRCEDYGLIPSGKNILKLKLWQEQGERCVYSGKKITQSDLRDESTLQIDHIYPYSRSYDDSQNNKVLVFTDANQNKREKTPYEAFGSDTQKWNQILGRIEKLPKAKKNRITNKNFANKEAGFIARNIVDTSYIARLSASYTDAFIEFLPLAENEDTTLGRGEKGSKKHISVVNGSLTATMRHYWGLNTLLDSEDSEKKDRSNHLHHALDAIIIAYVNDSVIKAFSDFKKTQEQNKARLIAKEIESAEYKISRRFFAPSGFENNEAFRQAIKRKILGQSRESRENDMSINSEATSEKLGGIFVSKPPRKRARGALHEETFGSICKENGEWIAKIKNLKQNKYETLYRGEENIKNAFKWGKIRKIHNKDNKTNQLLEKGEVKIGDTFTNNGEIIRTDIFKRVIKSNGKKDDKVEYYAVPIYTMDFALGVLPNEACPTSVTNAKTKNLTEWIPLDSNYTFCFSLFKNDLVAVKKKKTAKKGMENYVLGYYEGINPSNSSITIAKHDNYAQKEDLSDLSADEREIFKRKVDNETGKIKIIGEGVGIRNLEIFEKWEVSPLGEVSKAEFKEREPIALKSTPKPQED